MTEEEKIILTVEVNEKQALASYEALGKRAKELGKELKKLERSGKQDTEQYRQKKLALKAVMDQQREYARIIQNEIKANRQQGDSIEEMRAHLAKLKAEYAKLDENTRRSSRSLWGLIPSKLERDIRKTTLELSALEQKMGVFTRQVGNYPSAFSKFGTSAVGAFKSFLGPAALGIAAVQGLRKAIGNLVSTNKEFEQSNADLAAILGTTRDDIKEMTLEAKRLGETTIFTASQVTQLQTELAKLGFSRDEIKNSQEAVLKFAQATGAELAEAASVAGAAMRAFGMDATEMERIVSTMAVATTKSALTFDKLATAMPIVAPVARSFNFSIEETTALLGKLSDSGFDATMAATATRNILLNLANSSGKLAKKIGGPVHNLDELADALKKIDEQGISLAETFDLTDKRSVAAFNTFLHNAEGLKTLKENITDVGEAMDNMVDEKMSTLQASTKMLSSAWEGLMLTFSKSNGVLKGVVDWMTKLVRRLTDAFSKIDDLSEKRINNLAAGVKTNSASTYKNLVDQGMTNEEISDRYEKLAEQYAEKEAALRKEQAKIIEAIEKGESYTDENGKKYKGNKLTDHLHTIERRIASQLINLKRAGEILKMTEDKSETNNDDPYDPKAADKAAKAAAKAEKEWKARLQQLFTMLKKTEEEGADMIRRRYQMAIETASEATTKLTGKAEEELTEDEKNLLMYSKEYVEALQNQMDRDIEKFHENSLLKRIKREKELIEAASADQLKDWLITDEKRNNIEIENAEARKKAYKDELEVEKSYLKEGEQLSKETEQRITSMIVEEDNKIAQLKYQNILNEKALKLTEFTLTEDETYKITKEYLEKELEAVKGNIEKEAKLRLELRNLEVDHIEKKMDQDLSDYGLSERRKLDIKRKYLEMELEAVKGNADKERDIRNKLAELDSETLQRRLEYFNQFADAAMEITNTIANAISNRENRELEDYKDKQEKMHSSLEKRYNDGLITQEQYEARKAALDRQIEQREKELEIRQAKREKAISLAEAIINTALGVAKATASYRYVEAALIAATGAAQIATISAQQIPTAGKGMLIEGPSHANGGVLINAEGGEAIINKKATAKYAPLLSAINQSTGGVPIYGAGGAVGAQMHSAAIDAGIDYGKLAAACAQIQVQVAVTDINNGQARMAKVQQRKTY